MNDLTLLPFLPAFESYEARANDVDLAVAAGSSFSHTFATGIEFAAGNVVAVCNGASAGGPISFYLRGFLTNP
jgi:hypothetical protein